MGAPSARVSEDLTEKGKGPPGEEIGEDLQKQFEERDYEILGDFQRSLLKLPPRGPDGWTVEEILAWEEYRLQAMLKPVIMAMPSDVSGLQEELEKPRFYCLGRVRSRGRKFVTTWPDHVRLSDLEPRFVCKACGRRGGDVRPDFHWNKPPVAAMGYRLCLGPLASITASACRMIGGRVP